MYMKMHYTQKGTAHSPALIFAHSLGATARMWEEVAQRLAPYFRVITYDVRGHGASPKPAGPYTIGDLGGDVLALMDAEGIQSASFCGLSLGGLVGQWLAIHAPERIDKLVLSNTGAKIGSAESWQDRIQLVMASGFNTLADQTMQRWFSSTFAMEERAQSIRSDFQANDAQGYASCCHALAQADFRKHLAQIQVKTLVITGAEDPVTPAMEAQYLHENITDSELIILPGKHLPAVEYPVDYAETLIRFLVGESIYTRGMAVRRTVLGDHHVDQALRNTQSFSADFQKFITEYAWGTVWNRPDFSKRDRSVLTLGLLLAQNRPAELRMHLRAALRNGLTKEDLKEIILHSALYAGLPAANEAMHLAQDLFTELSL